MNDVHPSPATAWWKVRQSWWILLTLLPIGLGAWAAFLYVGVRARHRAWLLTAGVYGALLIFLLILLTLPSATWVPLVGGLTAIALWVVPFLHALGISGHYLRELRAREHGVAAGVAPAQLFVPGTHVPRSYPVEAPPAPFLSVLAWCCRAVAVLMALGGAILAVLFLYQGAQGILAGTGHLGVPGQVVVGYCSSGRGRTCTGSFTADDPNRDAGGQARTVTVEGAAEVGDTEHVRLVGGTAWPVGWAATWGWGPRIVGGLLYFTLLGAWLFEARLRARGKGTAHDRTLRAM